MMVCGCAAASRYLGEGVAPRKTVMAIFISFLWLRYIFTTPCGVDISLKTKVCFCSWSSWVKSTLSSLGRQLLPGSRQLFSPLSHLNSEYCAARGDRRGTTSVPLQPGVERAFLSHGMERMHAQTREHYTPEKKVAILSPPEHHAAV